MILHFKVIPGKIWMAIHAIITIAADFAVGKGIVVVNSAGNEGL